MTADDALIIFVKNPVPGKVKTRLATELGADKALKIYLKLLAKTRQTTQSLTCTTYLYYSSFVDTTDDWPEKKYQKRLQKGTNLGLRMHNAIKDCLLTHPRVVLIGSDIPEIKHTHLEEAFLALQAKDYVIGPAADGGYYLVGMKHPETIIFNDIPWSTPEVFELTCKRIEAEGKSCQVLATLSDVDRPEDWERIQW